MKELLVAMVLSLGVAQSLNASTNYPDHWWKVVDDTDAPTWEILPQEAIKNVEVILSKRNELGQMLSNLGHTPFTFRGRQYECVEGLWQSMKYPEGLKDERMTYPGLIWEFTRDEVAQKIGWEAMKAGGLGGANMGAMDINWVTFENKRMTYVTDQKGDHYKLIKSILKAKINTNKQVKKVLLSTGDLILKSDHHMGENPPPAWKYNEIYMVLRDELKREDD